MQRDWYDIKFLESSTNVRGIVGKSTGRAISASIAREISICIQQGRLFFEAAEVAPLQIKPLQIYYGIVAFAKAAVVAQRGTSLSTLTPGHGLKDVTRFDASVEELVLEFQAAGGFQEFNDAIAPLGRIWHFDKSMPQWIEKPFDLSPGLVRQRVTLKDILSRMPGLSKRFEQTFGQVPASIPITLSIEPPDRAPSELRIDDPNLYADRANLVANVRRWRSSYPFLTHWRFREAAYAWGNAVLIFDNVVKGGTDDLSDEFLVEHRDGSFSVSTTKHHSPTHIPPVDILPPLSGGFTHSYVSAMQPLAGVVLSEHSLEFVGTFLLGSLVRYRPQAWQNTISRSVTEQRPADDRCLSLIEQFLDEVLISFPQMLVKVIDYKTY